MRRNLTILRIKKKRSLLLATVVLSTAVKYMKNNVNGKEQTENSTVRHANSLRSCLFERWCSSVCLFEPLVVAKIVFVINIPRSISK